MSTRQEDLLQRIRERRTLREAAVTRVRERRGKLGERNALLGRMASRASRPDAEGDDEERFRTWYAERRGDLDPDPDSPLQFYDYRAAFRAGAEPQISAADGLPHWPSEYKRLGHPNLIVDGRDTRTGQPATETLQGQSEAARQAVARAPRAGGPGPGARVAQARGGRGDGPGATTGEQDIRAPAAPGDGVARRVTDTLKDVTSQIALGASEVGHRTAIGVAELGPDERRRPATIEEMRGGAPSIVREPNRAAANLRASRELARDTYGEADTGPGKVANALTQMVGEGTLFMVPGTMANRAGQMLSRTGQSNRFLNLITRPKGVGQRAVQNLVTGAPLDLAISQAGAEDSLAGAAAALTGSETLERVARSPAKRAAFDVATGFGAGTAIGEVVEAVARRRAARSARPSVDAQSSVTPPTPQEAPGSTRAPGSTGKPVTVTEPPRAAAAPASGAVPAPAPTPAQAPWAERRIEPPTRGRRQRTVFPGDDSKVETEFVVMEADDVRASHTADFSQRPAEEFPPEIQGRAYHGTRGRQAREHTEGVVSGWDPDRALDPTVSAADGPPIITAQGINIAGNGRTIAQQRLWQNAARGEQLIRTPLIERAAEFGIDPEVVRGMRKPILVRRVIDESVDVNDIDTLRRLNAASDVPTGKTKDVLSDAATRATQFRSASRAIKHFSETVADDDTIRSYLGTAGGREFMKALVDDGVISKSERARFIDATTGSPTDEGKQLIERVFYAAAIGDADVVARAPEGILRKLDTALPGLIRSESVEGWGVGGLVREALDLLASARAQNMGLDDLVAQVDLAKAPPADNVVAMARFLERRPKAEIRDAFRSYAEEAESFGRQTSSEDMFGHEPRPAGDAQGRFAALRARSGRRQAFDRLVGREAAARRRTEAIQEGRVHPLAATRDVDLFGEEIIPGGPAQGDLLGEGRGPQGMTAALDEARATASTLEGRVLRGSASAEEVRRYQEARSFIRRTEGRGLDRDELARQRERGPAPQPSDTGDLFTGPGATRPAVVMRDGSVYTGATPQEALERAQLVHGKKRESFNDFMARVEDPMAMQAADGTLIRSTGDDAGEGVESGMPTREQLRADRERITAEYRERGLVPLRGGEVSALGRTKASETLPEAGRFLDRPDAGPVVSPVKIVKELNDALDKALGSMKVAEGRFPASHRDALGIINTRRNVIRLKDLSEAPVMGHEAGHAMQKLFFGTVDGALTEDHLLLLPGAIRGELEDMAKGISDESIKEGWAEFWRRYLDNPPALYQEAPNTLRWVEDKLIDFPEIKNAWDVARADWTAFRESSAQARIGAKISVGDREAPVMSIADRWSRFRTAVLDDFEPIRKVVEHVREKAGVETIGEDAEALARLSRGSVGVANMFLEHGAISFRTLKRAGPSLRQVIEPVKGQLDDFRRYMVARRAQELHERNITTGFRGEDVDAAVQQLEERFGDTFKGAFDQLQEWNQRLLAYVRDAGVISPETFEAITEANQSYVPFYRVREGRRVGGSMGQTFGHLFSPVKRLKGSGRDLVDPLESMVKNAMTYTHIAQRQQVSAALGRLAEKEGVAKILDEIGTPIRPVQFRMGEIERDLEEIVPGLDGLLKGMRTAAEKKFKAATAGMTPSEIAQKGIKLEDPAEELLAVFRPGDYFGKPNMISVLSHGERRWYEVDPELYAALEGLDRESLDAASRWLGAPARTLRAGATLAPEFQIRNPLRDQVMAFVQSEYGYVPFVDMARGAFELIRKGEAYQQWLSAGGYRAALTSLDRNAMQNNLRQLVSSGGVANVVKHPLDALRALSAVMEDATRMGEFLNARRVHGTTKEGLQRAAAASREISVDFARHGAKLAGLRHMSAFWNARLQGYDRLARAAKKNPARFAAKAFSMITLPSLLEYYANMDDPDYWELPQWQRDLFWMVKVGDDWLSIPKPFELGLIFGTLPVRVLDSFVGGAGGAEEVRQFFGETLLKEAQGMFPSPTAVEPLIESVTNYSFFLRRPITPRSEENVRDRYQGGVGTSEVAEQLARWIPGEEGVSPRTIDNVLYAWTGGLGRLGTELADMALDPSAPATPARRVSEIPGVRGIMDPPAGFNSESIERFYREYSRAQTAVTTLRDAERDENREVYERELANEKFADLRQREPTLRRAANELAQLRAQAEAIRRDPDLTAEEKREQIDELGRDAIDVARGALGRALPDSR